MTVYPIPTKPANVSQDAFDAILRHLVDVDMTTPSFAVKCTHISYTHVRRILTELHQQHVIKRLAFGIYQMPEPVRQQYMSSLKGS